MALTTKDKKELALSLYLNTDKTQAEIAERVGVSENTLSAWAIAGNWKTMKGARTTTRAQLITQLYQQCALIEEAAVDDKGNKRAMNHKEIQSVKMITKSISELDKTMSLDTYIQVMEEMMTWIWKIAPEQAKAIMGKVDGFVNHKLGELE
jgi:transposase-like protein